MGPLMCPTEGWGVDCAQGHTLNCIAFIVVFMEALRQFAAETGEKVQSGSLPSHAVTRG